MLHNFHKRAPLEINRIAIKMTTISVRKWFQDRTLPASFPPHSNMKEQNNNAAYRPNKIEKSLDFLLFNLTLCILRFRENPKNRLTALGWSILILSAACVSRRVLKTIHYWDALAKLDPHRLFAGTNREDGVIKCVQIVSAVGHFSLVCLVFRVTPATGFVR